MQQFSHLNPYYTASNIQRNNYFCTSCLLPEPGRNYCIFDKEEVDHFVKQGEKALPFLAEILKQSDNEPQIVEVMHIMNTMIDRGIKGFDRLYPYFARFNNTSSPNIQSYLAGIYRKIQVPDAFGPLVNMLIKNSIQPPKQQIFDPNEEIGGAILSYLSDRFRH